MRTISIRTAVLFLLALTLACCTSRPKKITAIKGERITIDSTYDVQPDTAVAAIVAKYQNALNRQLEEVVGQSAREMFSRRPESLLSNFTADAMLAIAREKTRQKIDFSLMNFGGLRAIMPAGNITLYNLYTIYPFENTLVIITIEGKYLRELFNAFAGNKPEAMSNVQLSIKDKKVNSVTIDGKILDDMKSYTLVTLDFIAQGGDGMTVFANAAQYEPTGLLLREAMEEYIKSYAAKGKMIDSKIDGRVKIL